MKRAFTRASVEVRAAKRDMMKRSLEVAYDEGKRAYIKWYGAHGPTVRGPTFKTRVAVNPYTLPLLKEAWGRGFNGDVRFIHDLVIDE